MSLFLNTTSWPDATAAGLGVNASLPPWPVIAIVIVPGVGPPDGVVGVPPPPPQPAAMSAPAMASASVRDLRIDVVLQRNRLRRCGSKRGAARNGRNYQGFLRFTVFVLTTAVTAFAVGRFANRPYASPMETTLVTSSVDVSPWAST